MIIEALLVSEVENGIRAILITDWSCRHGQNLDLQSMRKDVVMLASRRGHSWGARLWGGAWCGFRFLDYITQEG